MLSSSLLNCLSFIKQIMIGCQFSVKRFDPFCFELFTPPFGEIVFLPKLERPSDFLANLLVLNLCVLLSVRFLLFNTLFGFQWTYLPISFEIGWWAQVDSNHRPRAYQARALTTWAMSPCKFLGVSRLSNRCRHFAAWWRWWESNPWPPACRAGALPAELHPHSGFSFFEWTVTQNWTTRDPYKLKPCSLACLFWFWSISKLTTDPSLCDHLSRSP